MVSRLSQPAFGAPVSCFIAHLRPVSGVNDTEQKDRNMTNRTLLRIAGGVAVAKMIYYLWLRPRHLRWGATIQETQETLSGDEDTQNVKGQSTRAITIYAPAAEVWKWLVQIGQDKGGFYSYAWLENLVGCHLHNSDRILPQFQRIQAGDQVWLHPKAPPLPVIHVEPGRAIVMGSNTSEPGTWGFYLKSPDTNITRLIVRSRGSWKPGLWRALFQYGVFEPAHFIMERKMMLTIKHLAERHFTPMIPKRSCCG